MIGSFGPIISTIITIPIYIIFGIIFVKIYDFYRIDFEIEEYKKARFNNEEFVPKNRITKLLVKFSGKGKKIANFLKKFIKSKNRIKKITNFLNKLILMILSALSFNPGLMVIHFRPGYNLYNGFAGKSIKIYFLVSIIITNIYWNLAWYTGFSILNFIF